MNTQHRKEDSIRCLRKQEGVEFKAQMDGLTSRRRHFLRFNKREVERMEADTGEFVDNVLRY